MLYEALAPETIHMYVKNEHVPIEENSIQTIKERHICTFHAVLFKRYTTLTTEYLVVVLHEALAPETLHMFEKNEHVPIEDNSIKTIK